jgi:4-amino-4-deoxy-L-arabinose transferase-like glycosyltransferase
MPVIAFSHGFSASRSGFRPMFLRPITEWLAAHPKATLAGITLVKVLAFLLLHGFFHMQPFVGDNATSHWIPVAHRMLDEGRFNGPDSRPDSKIGPGYSAVIALSIRLLGSQYLSGVVLIQFGADLTTSLAIFAIARRMMSVPMALLAAAFWLVFPPALLISGWITSETIFIALFTVSTALLLEGFYENRLRLAVWAGIVLGTSAYFRTTPILLPLFYLPVWLLFRKYREALLFCCATYLAILPWTIRNQVVLDDRIPVAVGLGSTIVQGSDSRFFSGEGKKTLYPEVFAEAARAGIVKPASDKESGIDSWMGRVGWYQYEKRWRDRPLSFFSFGAHKFSRLWYGTESARWKSEALAGFCSLLVVPLGAVQFYRWRRKWNPAMWFVAAQLTYFVALHWIALPEIRYMLPVYPLFLIGATALVWTWRSRSSGMEQPE